MDISVALSFDNNYAAYAHVVVYSALKNKLTNTRYHFYFLVPSDLEDGYKENLTALCNKHSCEATFIDMRDEFANAKTWGYFTTPVYYRLSLENLVPEDKCIYLDCDTLVLRDLSELFSINIEDHYVAGVCDVMNVNKPRYLKRLAICEPMMYINTGVMLLNLKNLRKNDVKKRVNELIDDETFQKLSKFPDQDALNKIYNGHVKILPPRFNWFDRFTKNFRGSFILEKLYPGDDLGNIDPMVVHFIGDEKPWSIAAKPEGKFSDIWWEYAEKTEVYSEILLKTIKRDMKFVAQLSRDRFKILINYWRCRLLALFYIGSKKEHYKTKAAKMCEQWRFVRSLLGTK